MCDESHKQSFDTLVAESLIWIAKRTSYSVVTQVILQTWLHLGQQATHSSTRVIQQTQLANIPHVHEHPSRPTNQVAQQASKPLVHQYPSSSADLGGQWATCSLTSKSSGKLSCIISSNPLVHAQQVEHLRLMGQTVAITPGGLSSNSPALALGQCFSLYCLEKLPFST